MAKTIAIFNQKGGVGKSTTTSNLMAVLKMKGKRVLGIDIDSQSHLTKLCGIKTQGENTVMEILMEEATFEETVKTTNFGDVIPADRNLQNCLREFSENINGVFKLQELVEKVDDSYDYIIFDCPPNANQITLSALVACKYVVVPSELEGFSLDGVAEISRTISNVQKKLNPTLKVLGVLIVKYQPRRMLTKVIEAKMEELAQSKLGCGLFKTKIEYGVVVPLSQANYISLIEFDKKSKPAKSYVEFANEIIKEVE